MIKKPFRVFYDSNDISIKYKKAICKTNNSEVINYIDKVEEDDTIKKLKKLLDLNYNDIYEIFIKEEQDDLYKNFNNIKKFEEYVKKKQKRVKNMLRIMYMGEIIKKELKI